MTRSVGVVALAVAAWATVAASSVAMAGPPVDLKSSDGVVVRAAEYGKGSNAVILVHDKGRTREDWAYFAERLGGAGYHVLAVDLRGHGGSHPPDALTDADFPKMALDVAAAARWFESLGVQQLVVIGASFGANVALAAAAEDPKIDSVVLLSPGLNLSGVTLSGPIEKFGERPSFVIASNEDAYSVRSANLLDSKARGDCEVLLLENAGSGVRMLNKDPSLEALLLAWLNGSYQLANGQRQPIKVNTGDKVDIQTSGKKFGE